MAVVRFRAKIDTSVTEAIIRSTRKVPTTDKGTDGEGQGGGDHAAEDEEQEEQGDGQGDGLGPDQVVLDLVADLVEDLGVAGDLHVEDAAGTLQLGDDLADALVDLVLGAEDATEHEGVVAVLAAQRRLLADRPVRHDVADLGDGVEALGERQAGRLRLGAVDRRRVAAALPRCGGEQDDVGHAGVEAAEHDLVGLERLAAGVVEPGGGQVLGDVAAHRPAHGEERHGAHQHGPPSADDQICDACEHQDAPCPTLEVTVLTEAPPGRDVDMTCVTSRATGCAADQQRSADFGP
jgi:hypothetical protein